MNVLDKMLITVICVTASLSVMETFSKFSGYWFIIGLVGIACWIPTLVKMWETD